MKVVDMSTNQKDSGSMGSQMNHSSTPQDQDTRVYWEILDRTSLELELDDQQGTLFKVLDVFKQNNVNQTSISSRPPKQINDKKIVRF